MSTTQDDFFARNDDPFELRKGLRLLNDSSVYFKGLVGMILCILPGAIIGLVLIKMSLEQAKKAIVEYNAHTTMYDHASFDMVKKGQLFSRIGLILFILEILIILFVLS